jgi:hypothetical protein
MLEDVYLAIHDELGEHLPDRLVREAAQAVCDKLATRTPLEAMKAALRQCGINFVETAEVGDIHVSGDREWYDHPVGGKAFRWVNEVRAAYDTRIDTDVAGGHADVSLFFKDGKCLHSAGWER